MVVKKVILDKLIRIIKKYQKTGDTDILSKKFDLAKEAFGDRWCTYGDLIYSLCALKCTYKKIYEVLGVIGVEVKEDGNLD